MDDIADLINNANPSQRTAAIAVAYELAESMPPVTYPDRTIVDAGGHIMHAIRHTLTN